jgi:branched-chain amino acid transport system substrate-binding protein
MPIFQGAQIWVKWVNTRGGVNGHQVNLLVYDDGCDPQRHRAQVQEAVEQRKVQAFLGNVEPFTGQPSVEYVTQKKIPVVGISLGETWDYTSPMYFPQASAGHAVIYTGLAAAAQQLLPEGKKKLASLVCAEAQLCRDGDAVFGTAAKEYGFEHVYRAQASLAQPDFTAECLNAKNAGADVMIILLDSNSITRITNSCARQGFKPNYATVSSLITEDQGQNPNLAGMSGSSPTFPWFQTGTPMADEFQQAMKTVGANVPPGLGPATGWTSGKLFELATRNLAEPPTNVGILQGLWNIKDNDLGGITQPLTFTEGQPAKPISCWWNIRLKDKKWISPDGFKRQCAPAPKTTT